MKLYFDSTNNLKTLVRLGEKELIKTYQTPREQNILGAIDELMKQESVEWKGISEIEVKPGPGSFTGSRLGVAIANALGFALSIPINGQRKPVAVAYSAPASITKSRRS